MLRDTANNTKGERKRLRKEKKNEISYALLAKESLEHSWHPSSDTKTRILKCDLHIDVNYKIIII